MREGAPLPIVVNGTGRRGCCVGRSAASRCFLCAYVERGELTPTEHEQSTGHYGTLAEAARSHAAEYGVRLAPPVEFDAANSDASDDTANRFATFYGLPSLNDGEDRLPNNFILASRRDGASSRFDVPNADEIN